MAGSLNHIVDSNNGEFTEGLIDNLGDAGEALLECFTIIHYLTGGDKGRINSACDYLGFPRIDHDMVS